MSLTHEDVENLLKVLDASQFDELQLETEGTKLTLRRRSAAVATAAAEPAPAAAPAVAQAAAPAAAAMAAVAAAPSTAAVDAGLIELRSPMLGTFYAAPKPGAAPFVQVGSRVEIGSTVGIIEVMKLMNSLPAESPGEVAQILVRDGSLVEFDQVLMRLRPL